jgi:hypothetical protein
MEYVEIQLTEAQVQSFRPLIREAAINRRNCLFVTVAPNGLNAWRLQAVTVPAAKAGRILKAIQAAAEPTRIGVKDQ